LKKEGGCPEVGEQKFRQAIKNQGTANKTTGPTGGKSGHKGRVITRVHEEY